MNVPLKHRQQEWLEQQVAAGRFQSLDEAVETAIAQLQSDCRIEDGWAKPAIEEALASLDRGEGTAWKAGETLARLKAARAKQP